MKLTRVSALLVGVLTALLFAALVALPTYFSSHPGSLTGLEFGLLTVGVLCAQILWAFYLFYLHRTDAVPAARKGAWHGFLLFGSLLTMPIFWYLYMWRPSGKVEANSPKDAA